MTAEKYLKQKEKSIELFPANYGKRSTAVIPQKRLVRPTNVNIIIQQKRKQNQKLQKDFKALESTMKIISGGLKVIETVQKTKLGLIMLGAAALLSTVAYLKNLADGNTDGDYTGTPESYDGVHYSGSDEKTQIKNKIIDEAKAQGVDPNLALAVADQESAFNPKATSQTGARGIFQMTTPACKQVGIPFDDKLYNADYNIKYGIKYLKWCLDNTKTVEEALVAWNSGIGNLQKAKKAGQDLSTLNSTKTVSKDKGFTTQVLPKIEKYKKERDNLTRSYSTNNANKQEGTATIKSIVEAAKKGAGKKSTGYCAKFVVDYLEKAGVRVTRQASAYMLADVLAKHPNFIEVDPKYAKLGDIVINGRNGSHPHGHIFVFDGKTFTNGVPNSGWSDFAGVQVNPANYGPVRVFRYLEKQSKPTNNQTPKNNVNQNNENKPKQVPPQKKPETKPTTPPQNKNQTPTTVQVQNKQNKQNTNMINTGVPDPMKAKKQGQQNRVNKKKN